MSESQNSADQTGVSVMIVAFNSASIISECIESIGPACKDHSFEILMIDNGDLSTEELVKARYPHVTIVQSQGNVGFAKANNLLAHESSSKFLLLLNPDVVLEPGAIDALVEGAARYPDAAAWGGVTVDRQGEPDNGNFIAMPSYAEYLSVAVGRSIIGNRPPSGVDRDAKTDVLTGGFVMISRSAWDLVSGLDESYFLYSEEVDLFYRLANRGWDFWRISASRGFHDIAHGNGLSSMRMLYRAAGAAHFVRKHWSPLKARAAIVLIWLAAFERYLVGSVLGRWKPHLKKLSEGHSRVALEPNLWMNGYAERNGLKVKLDRAQDRKP